MRVRGRIPQRAETMADIAAGVWPASTRGFSNLLADPTDSHIHLSLYTHTHPIPLPTTMASRTAVSRLANVASASKSLRPLSTAATSRLVSKNALASTAMARVSRSEGRMLVGDAARRYASSEEGGSTMVSGTGKPGGMRASDGGGGDWRIAIAAGLGGHYCWMMLSTWSESRGLCSSARSKGGARERVPIGMIQQHRTQRTLRHGRSRR